MPTDRAAILMAIKPRWWNLVRAGDKTAELRRVTPVDLVAGMPIVWYVSSPTSAIAGEAVCDSLQRLNMDGRRAVTNARTREAACVSRAELQLILGGASSPCAIWLREVREYSNPMRHYRETGFIHIPDPARRDWLIRPPQCFTYLFPKELAAIRAAGGDGDD